MLNIVYFSSAEPKRLAVKRTSIHNKKTCILKKTRLTIAGITNQDKSKHSLHRKKLDLGNPD